MTTLNEAREAIFQQFVDAWGSQTALTLQNENFETDGLSEWARLVVLNTASQQDTLGVPGSRQFERLGTATVSIFVKGGTGTQRLDELATIAQGAFEGFTLTISSVTFLDVTVNEIGPDESWYQYNVVANFRYFETK